MVMRAVFCYLRLIHKLLRRHPRPAFKRAGKVSKRRRMVWLQPITQHLNLHFHHHSNPVRKHQVLHHDEMWNISNLEPVPHAHV